MSRESRATFVLSHSPRTTCRHDSLRRDAARDIPKSVSNGELGGKCKAERYLRYSARVGGRGLWGLAMGAQYPHRGPEGADAMAGKRGMPGLRRHRGRGRGLVRLNGHDWWLGAWPVTVFRPGQKTSVLFNGPVISGEDVLSGFSCSVVDLFP